MFVTENINDQIPEHGKDFKVGFGKIVGAHMDIAGIFSVKFKTMPTVSQRKQLLSLFLTKDFIETFEKRTKIKKSLGFTRACLLLKAAQDIYRDHIRKNGREGFEDVLRSVTIKQEVSA